MKIALIERLPVRPLEKMLAFENWMANDYFLSVSGGLFANLFFSPKRRTKMIKNLNSQSRELRLRGVRNATWDTTYIQGWSDRARKEFETNKLWVGASNDKAVLKTAGRILSTDDFSGKGAKAKFLEILREDWGDSAAEIIFEKYRENEARYGDANRPANMNLPVSHWQKVVRELEAQI